MNLSMTFYCVAAPLLLAISAIKGATGGGFGLLAVPVLSLVIPPATAAAIVLPVFCAMDLIAVCAFPPRTWDWRNLRLLLPSLTIGIALGTVTFTAVNEATLQVIVGALAIAFSVGWYRSQAGHANVPRRGPQPLRALSWGAASGFASYIVNSGGPPLSMFLLPQRLDKTRLAGTMVIALATANLLKVIPYVCLGQLDGAALRVALVLIPCVVIGIGIGKRLHHRLSTLRIYAWSYGVLLLTGTILVGRALI